MSGIWDVPYGKDKKGVVGELLGGWSLAPIFSAHTGAPFTIYDCSNANLVCNRMIQTGPGHSMSGSGSPLPVPGQPNQYTFLDLSTQLTGVGSYADPITGTSDFGPYPSNMTGRNPFRQPGAWLFDMGVYKNFKLKKEGTSVQFRSEFYNLFNHSNLHADIGSADISSTSYIPAFYGGQNSATAERRNIQFALKFIF